MSTKSKNEPQSKNASLSHLYDIKEGVEKSRKEIKDAIQELQKEIQELKKDLQK